MVSCSVCRPLSERETIGVFHVYRIFFPELRDFWIKPTETGDGAAMAMAISELTG